MNEPKVRITLNDRSKDQLLAVMRHYQITNPTHMVQTMITQLFNSLNQSQFIEDNNNNASYQPEGM